MTSERPHVVIVGGGFAGLDAARALKRALVDITLVDRNNHHLFQPLLYQVATAGLSPGDIAAPIRWVLRKQENVRVLLAEVRGVDVERKCVQLDSGQALAYDALIVASGASHSYFGHDEWAGRAPGLKSVEDALDIRRRVLLAFERAERERDPEKQSQHLTFVIVGGGPTGVELAGALAEIARQTLRDEFWHIQPEAARIILVEAGDSILQSFPAPLRDAARRDLKRLDVEVLEQTMVTGIDAGGVQVGERTIGARTVLWAAGVKASGLGASLGAPLDKAGRVKVEGDLSIPGHPEVFVVGDLAALDGPDGQPLPGVAQVAKQTGKAAAKNVIRRLEGEPTQTFRYLDLGSMATIGRSKAIADLGWLRLTGVVAWLAWLFIHLIMLVGFRNKVIVFVQWLGAYLTYQRGVRLITGQDVARSERLGES